MKKFFLNMFVLILFNTSYGQTRSNNQTCHQKYIAVFEKRGATEVSDGVYDDVIITFRKGSMADCFYGKVTVKNRLINTNEMYLKFEDGTFEKINRKYRYPDQAVEIGDGISKTMITVDDELITVLFVKKIKPKKKSYAKAADPDFDF